MHHLAHILVAAALAGCASAGVHRLDPPAPAGGNAARDGESPAPGDGPFAPPQQRIRELAPARSDSLLAGGVLLGVAGLLLGLHAADPVGFGRTQGPEVAHLHEGTGVPLLPPARVESWRRRLEQAGELPPSPVTRAVPPAR